MMKSFLVAILGIFIVLSAAGVSAADVQVVINSEDWRDVYSGIRYSRLIGASVSFLTTEAAASSLLSSLDKSDNIIIISSSDPFVYNYGEMFRGAGFSSVEEITGSDLNLRLVEDLPYIRHFVVVSDLYGYPAIAVSPYANIMGGWVFFADDSNIREIDEILRERNVEELLVYGYVDPEVREGLEKYSPEVIYNVNRFRDNIDLVEKFMKNTEVKQILLSNGEFIEMELVTSQYPVVFTGRENVPESIQEYLKGSNIEIGVLIGNELVNAATNIRRTTGISVMVKFARGARGQTGGVAAVEGLDIFPVPTPVLGLEVYSVEYNSLSRNLEVTYKSSSSLPVWLRGTITIGEGEGALRVRDEESIFINPESYKTVAYVVEQGSSLEGQIANVFAIYGETRDSLDRVLSVNMDIRGINVIDSCEIEIMSADYHLSDNEFSIKVNNVADVDCYVSGVIKDLQLDLESRTVGSEETIKIPAGRSGKIKIEQRLTEKNIEKNRFVKVAVSYGERETSLIKVKNKELELNIVSIEATTYALAALALISAVSLFLYVRKRRRDRKSFEF